MKKWIGFLLFLSLLLTSLPLAVFAAPSGTDIERDDYENVAAKTYKEDEYLIRYDYEQNSIASSGLSFSSGSPDRWNGFWPRKYSDLVADPLNASNKVLRLFTESKSTVTKSFLESDEEFVLATSLMIPAPETGSYPKSLAVKLSNTQLLTFTYDTAASRYTWSCGSESGVYLPGTWVRVYFHVTPDATEGMAKAQLRITLSGAFCDGSAQPLPTTRLDAREFAYTAGRFDMIIDSYADGISGIYLDDTSFCKLGDFAPPTVELPRYDDPAGNVDLAGQFTVRLYHEPDPATFDVTGVKLTDQAGNEVAYTSRTYDTGKPTEIVYDFSENPLSPHTLYTFTFPEGITDMVGKAMAENTVSFRTQGREGERPASHTLADPPEGGYIMPDRYNTGYRCDESDLVDFFEKYPLFSNKSTEVIITEDLARAYNYEFSGFKLTGTLRIKATSPVYIHDFYLWADGYYGIRNESSERLTVAWAECENSLATMFNGKNLTLSHVYCHDVKADHSKGESGQIYESCYFRDGGTRSLGAHADVIQFSGSITEITQDVRVLGCRFDIPNLGYDHVANAAIFMKPEHQYPPYWDGDTQGYANFQVSYNWFNGGGFTTYIVTNGGPVENFNDITYSHNYIGIGCMYGPIALDEKLYQSENFNYHDNGTPVHAIAGSVVYYDAEGNRVFDVSDISESGKVLVNLANYGATARDWRVAVELVDADGNTVKTFTDVGTLVRNQSAKEYMTDDNLQFVLDENGNKIPHPDNGQPITELIKFPDLPSDVPCEIALTELPADLTGYSLTVRVYDTTDTETVIRSSVLTESVEENTLLPKPVLYTVTFQGKDGQILKTEQVLAGAAATAPTAPTVAGYEFAGWSADFSAVSSDLTVLATYVAVYQVTFLGRDGQTLKTEAVRAGGAATAPTAPSVAGYRFTGWDVDFSCVNSNLTVTAQYAPIPTYTVTFLGKDGAVLATQTVLEGQSATAPTAPQVDGYTFVGWSDSFFAVTSDLTVTAQYEPIPVYVPSAEMLAFREAVATAETATGTLAARRAALLAAAEAYLAVPTAERAQGQTEYETLSALADALSAALSAANDEAAVAGEIAHSLGRLGDNR